MYQRIKAIRKQADMTQKEFGESLGVSRDVYANIENARVDPSKTFIQLMCSTYNVDIEWLTTGKGNMRAEPKQSFLEELSGEYGLSFTAQKIIESYLNAGDEQRAKMDLFLNDIADSLSSIQEESESPAVIDNVIEVYKAADSTSGKEHGVVSETREEIERLKNVQRVTHKDDF